MAGRGRRDIQRNLLPVLSVPGGMMDRSQLTGRDTGANLLASLLPGDTCMAAGKWKRMAFDLAYRARCRYAMRTRKS